MAWEAGGYAGFSLKVKAQKPGSLSELLRISDEITRAEAYTVTQYLAPTLKSRISLRFGKADAAFELFQNQPNPYTDKTAITFQLPEASAATLTILDANGKTLWAKSSNWPAGMNTVETDLTGQNAAGILFYKLETPTKSDVRKMVRLKTR